MFTSNQEEYCPELRFKLHRYLPYKADVHKPVHDHQN